jgi:hypothetical protein
MGSKSGWALYHQGPQDLGVAIQQRHHEGFRLKGMVMDVYKPSLVRNHADWPNCWMRSRIDVPQVDQDKICSMKDVALAVKSIILHSP